MVDAIEQARRWYFRRMAPQLQQLLDDMDSGRASDLQLLVRLAWVKVQLALLGVPSPSLPIVREKGDG